MLGAKPISLRELIRLEGSLGDPFFLIEKSLFALDFAHRAGSIFMNTKNPTNIHSSFTEKFSGAIFPFTKFSTGNNKVTPKVFCNIIDNLIGPVVVQLYTIFFLEFSHEVNKNVLYIFF